MNCQDCQDRLFDYDDGRLSPSVREEVESHLNHCDDCAALLQDIWQMSQMTHRWENARVPSWRKQDTFFESSSWQWPQMLAMAASVLALVLVLMDVHITTTDNGITLARGNGAAVTQQVEAQLASYADTQADLLNQRLDEYSDQQAANNQLMLTTLLQASRQERRDDMTSLVSYLNTAQAQQHRETQDSLQYLLASQQQDEKDIRQMGEAIKLIGYQKGSDM